MSIKAQMFKRGAKATAQGSKKFGIGTALTVGLPVLGAVGEYNTARSEGANTAMAAGRAVGEYVIGETLGLAYLPISMATSIPSAAINAGQSLSAMSRNMNRAAVGGPFQNAMFNDNQRAYTMRQAGMQMAQASKYNLQQTLMGNEAQYMHV